MTRKLEPLAHRQVGFRRADISEPKGSLKHAQCGVALPCTDVRLRQAITRFAQLGIALHRVVEDDECALEIVIRHVNRGKPQPWLDAMWTEIDRLVKGVD